MNAIGLIEVIGYVAAIEASDACVKSANVSLVNIDKVGKGIVTLTITGDVGAVKSAVEAGEIAAERVGILRSTHVIPRPHKDVYDAIFKKEIEVKCEENIVDEAPIKVNEEDYIHENDDASNKELQEVILEDVQIESKKESVVENKNDRLDYEEVLNKIDISDIENLSKMSMKELKVMAKELDSSMTNRKLNALKKEELINLVDELYRKDK